MWQDKHPPKAQVSKPLDPVIPLELMSGLGVLQATQKFEPLANLCKAGKIRPVSFCKEDTHAICRIVKIPKSVPWILMVVCKGF